jgi:hypothetical protein
VSDIHLRCASMLKVLRLIDPAMLIEIDTIAG